MCVHRRLESKMARRISVPGYAGDIAWVPKLEGATDEPTTAQ
jgi:hypothetical protein